MSPPAAGTLLPQRDISIVPNDPAGRTLPLFSGPVHVVEEGPPGGGGVLLLHGAPGSVRDFRYLGPALAARGLRAIRVDLPGFGETPKDTWPRLDPTGRAGFLAATASALGLARFAVVGHSVGGTVALLAAALFPRQVTALGLVNSVGTHRHRGLSMPEGLARPIGRALRSPHLAPHLLPQIQATYRRLGIRGVDALGAEALALHSELIAGLDFRLLRWAARNVACPTLLASAADDPLIEPEVAFAFAGAFDPKVSLRHLHFQEGGHYLQKHQAGRLAHHLDELLGGR